jgi:hypothetical protein
LAESIAEHSPRAKKKTQPLTEAILVLYRLVGVLNLSEDAVGRSTVSATACEAVV